MSALAQKLRLLAVTVALGAVVAGLALWVVAGRLPAGAKAQDAGALSQSAFQQQTGVRVVRVALLGGGGLVDLRYQVVDPDKAEVVHDQPPKLVDERTGKVIDTLFMGHAHGGQPKAGYTYPLLFVNQQGLVERGDAVSVVIADSRLEHVAVR